MFLRYIGVVLSFVLCVQVSQCNMSLSRVLERLDELEGERSSLGDRLFILENKLSRERRHRREDVKALNQQLESLRQTCGCDTSQSVTPGQVLAKTQTVQEKSPVNAKLSMVSNLRLAFMEEKRENTRLRSELAKKYDNFSNDLKQTMANVTANIMDTKQDLLDKHNNLVFNVTRLIDVSNRTIVTHVLDSTRAIEDLKDKIVNEMNTFKMNISTDIAASELRLIDKHSTDVDNLKLFIENVENTVNKSMSTVKLALDSFQEQTIHNTSKILVLMKMGLFNVVRFTSIEVCPRSESASGVYFLNSSSPILDTTPVYCDTTTDGGGWLVFQRRQDGTVDFFRNWAEYKHGFGDLSTEFWWGLEKLNAATRDKPRELRIELEDFSGNTAYAHYTSFSIASESDKYALSVSGYSGTAGFDALIYHNGKPFSTKDRDHDGYYANCAVEKTGAWWFEACHHSHLNGKYRAAGGSFPRVEGPVWLRFNSWNAVKFTEMKLR